MCSSDLAMTNIATIFAPLLSAQILAVHDIEIEGYYTMFKVVIAMFVIISFLSTLVKSPVQKLKFSVLDNLKTIKSDIQWNFVVRTQFLWGFRDAAVMSLTGILIYQSVTNGAAYGRLLALFALIATLSNYVVGKVVEKKTRLTFHIIGALGIFTSGMSLVVLPGFLGAVAHGTLANLFFAFMSIPYSIIVMNIISDYMPNENIIGRTTTREIMTASGRVVGLSFLLVVITINPDLFGLKLALTLIYIANLLIALSTYIYDHKKHPRLLEKSK